MITVDRREARNQPRPDNPFVEFPKREIEGTLHGRFERVVDRGPERPAVITRRERLTYRTLNALANRAAHAIVARSNREAEPVALLFQQGAASIIATLATLKAGKFYVPLDPHLPMHDATRLLEDSRARLVVTDARHLPLARELGAGAIDLLDLDRVDRDGPAHDLGVTSSADDLAYVYYTSGSTGRPKGVMDTHRNVLHNIMRYTNRLHISAADRLTLLQPFGFSGVVSSLFGALLNGACVFPIDVREETPNAVATWLRESRITIYHSVPALYRALLAEGTTLPSARVVRLEGDQASSADVALYRKSFGPDCLLVNGLGTTETGIVCQYFVDRTMHLEGGKLPIGYPADDVEIRIVDADGNPVAAGEVGEIAVASRYLSPGYWQNPELTCQAFARDPRDHLGRVYRTRDLGRLRSDGCIEYLGRGDGRVKIRGQWVTLADVESALLALDEVRAAVVTAQVDEAGDARLVAHVVAGDSRAPSVSQLRRRLTAALPAFMMPARFVMLDTLPLNDNGKVDRRALPPSAPGRPRLEHEFAGPESLLQIRVARIWEDVLDVHPVGIRDNFFDLGGDSLQAARMLERLEAVFDRTIALSILLEAADVETLADLLFERSEDLRFPLLPVQPHGSKPPLFFLHGDYLSGGFYCAELARHLGPDQPFYALPPFGLDDRPIPPSYELMAAQHLETLRAFRPRGPYLLGGTCNGGLVAFEMARQLVDAGQQVDRLILIGSSASNRRFRAMQQTITAAGTMLRLPARLQMALYEDVRRMMLEIGHRPLRGAVRQVVAEVRKAPIGLARLLRSITASSNGTTRGLAVDRVDATARAQREHVRETYLRIDRHYVPGTYANPVSLFWPEDDPEPAAQAARWWGEVAPMVDLHVIPGTHLGSLTADLKRLAERLKRCLG